MRNEDVEEVGDCYVLVQDTLISRYSDEVGLLPVGEGELNSLIV